VTISVLCGLSIKREPIQDIRSATYVLALETWASSVWISQAFGFTGPEITKGVYAPYVQVMDDKFEENL